MWPYQVAKPEDTTQKLADKVERAAYYDIQARTKGDAIMEAQKRFAKDFGLDRTEEALVRIEFEKE